ncbi:MAG: hypothetical protein HC833_19330 [Leptolyngbyaceae cyanobacterium RM1_406_9]|nr:hypothetical protein [Leptolyngbyaceae cyanobacterium RM1_406_9]
MQDFSTEVMQRRSPLFRPPPSALRPHPSSLVSLVTKLPLGNALQKLQLLLGLQEAGASSDGSQSGAWEPENRLF